MREALTVRAVDLRFPFTGRWLTQNSPANRVPSHGTTRFASAYAIDFVPVDGAGRTALVTFGTLVRPEPPDRFPGFGRPVLAPIDGLVVAVHDAEPDHDAYRGLPSLGYALTQARRARTTNGLAGNHVLIRSGDVVLALCHLQQGSVAVRVGQRVAAGQPLGGCGNSGNSTEPHLHVQAMDSIDMGAARAVPLTFEGSLPRDGEIVDAGVIRPGR